ncbi:hypothetical protein [Odoribacter lunatus]|uniref:hypothetical protein n=1 Tax=Odoribacter lunatus TaxID=2941335 RepID=UPI0020426C58|nr:hypothetical protein [Odoribacter lunatus]
MKNCQQCEGGLCYSHFSIILIQTFTSSDISVPKGESFLCSVVEGNIDEQLFTHKEKIVERYQLPGFNIKIVTETSRPITLEGYVHVWAAVFFDATVQISYRLVVPCEEEIDGTKFCRISCPLTTDDLIAIAGVVQGVEHWIYDVKKARQEIDGSLKTMEIKGLRFDKKSFYCEQDVFVENVDFEEVQRRYRGIFDKVKPDDFRYGDHNYILIDVWETVGHGGKLSFDTMEEAEIIEHIEKYHRSELIGLMTLYPEEWPYRMESAFEEVCGKNIAIDTDDLVLANENVAVVFGTYGKRGGEAPTDWVQHLGRRDRYHVSWPEYLVLLEILLAKKHLLNYVQNKYIYNSQKATDDNAYKMIDQNARLSVKLSNMVLQLNLVRYLRYMSHKHMYNKTAHCLKIEEEERQLNETIERIDKSLDNINNAMEIRQSNDTKYILFFISVASLFGVLLQGNEVPVFSRWSKEIGENVAVSLVLITCFCILCGILVFTKMILGYVRKWKSHRTKKKF